MNDTDQSYCGPTIPRSPGTRALRIAGFVVAGLCFATVFALVFALVVQWLWNMILPDLFGFKYIGYWQAFGLIILLRLLFGGHGWHRKSDWHHKKYGPGAYKSAREEMHRRWHERHSPTAETTPNE